VCVVYHGNAVCLNMCSKSQLSEGPFMSPMIRHMN